MPTFRLSWWRSPSARLGYGVAILSVTAALAIALLLVIAAAVLALLHVIP